MTALRRLGALPVAARAGLAGLVVAVAVLVVVLVSDGAGPLPGLRAAPAALADPVPYDGRSPLQPAGPEQRVLVQLPRVPLGRLPDARAMGADAKRVYIASLKKEASKLRSALAARGVVLRDVVAFNRVWNGFAATVSTRDIPRLESPGVRVRTVRRAYPATGEAVPVPGRAPFEPVGLGGQPAVAVLDTGVDVKALGDHADPGYDAVDRNRDPAPGRERGGTRRETSGTALAGVLVAAGERVLPIRVAALRASGGAAEASAGSDELINGLEHAVDPNGDSDTSDHVPVALVGVNASYAGFSNSPEARAVKGAAGLGTLVVAPAGNEGAAAAGSGTVGSPASAPEALAVGALTGPEPAARATLDAGGERIAEAAVLAGAPPRTAGLETAGPVEDTDPAVLGRAQTRIRGKVVIVRAGANPAAQAAAAAAVGALAVLLADPRERPLPAMAAGRAAVPVLGVTGEGAEKLLKIKPGTDVGFGATARGPRSDAPETPRVSPFASQGPSAGGLPKPDLAAPASALTTGVGGGAVVVGGSAVAAARVAAVASKLARTRPELSPAELRAAVIAASDPAGLPADRAGAGTLRTPPAAPGITSDPPAAVSGALDPISVELNTAVSAGIRLRATAGATVQPGAVTLRPGTPAAVTVRLPQGGTALGRLEALDPAGKVTASVPWLVRPDTVDPVALGPLRVSRGRRVRFTLGAFKRGERTSIGVAERLVLDLVDAKGNVRRSLTVAGGARELMPAEYAYTLPAATLKQLPAGTYAFRARAWAPRQEEPTTKQSTRFRR